MFPKTLAQEKEARCNLAAERFGRERISCLGLSGLIDQMIKGETLAPYFASNSTFSRRWISKDGTFLDNEPPLYQRSDQKLQLADAVVEVTVLRFGTSPFSMLIKVYAGTRTQMQMGIRRGQRAIFLAPFSDDDLDGVALVQALLSRGLSQALHDAEQAVDITVQGDFNPPDVTWAGLMAQIAPILPYGTHCKSFYAVATCIVQERVRIPH
jgi:hypothetical protein